MGYITIAELARRLNYSRQRIDQLVKKGVIKAEKCGKFHIISTEEAEKWELKGKKVDIFTS